MGIVRTKIVIDADVIIHFIKGGYLHIIHTIFPAYEYIILDVVLKEVRKHSDTRKAIDNHICLLKNLKEVKWNPEGEMIKEYANLTKRRGEGESACMIYCKYNQDVIASSNLNDIRDYCEQYNITYLTTLDFIYEAFRKQIMTEDECNTFIQDVIKYGSRIPNIKIGEYRQRVQI